MASPPAQRLNAGKIRGKTKLMKQHEHTSPEQNVFAIYSTTYLNDVHLLLCTSQTHGEEQLSHGPQLHSCSFSAYQQYSLSSTSSDGHSPPFHFSTSSQWPSTALYGMPFTQVSSMITRHTYRKGIHILLFSTYLPVLTDAISSNFSHARPP